MEEWQWQCSPHGAAEQQVLLSGINDLGVAERMFDEPIASAVRVGFNPHAAIASPEGGRFRQVRGSNPHNRIFPALIFHPHNLFIVHNDGPDDVERLRKRT